MVLKKLENGRQRKKLKLVIIAISAIGADPQKTWHRRHDIPSYSNIEDSFYNSLGGEADVYLYRFPESAGSSDLESCAHELLTELFHNNQIDITNADECPALHLAAHSTGGLALKLALVRAFEDNRETGNYEALIERCFSVAFFGVPHHGSDILAGDPYQATIQERLHMQTGLGWNIRDKLRLLNRENNYLENINERFVKEAARLRVIWSFYETMKTEKLNSVIVDEHSATVSTPEAVLRREKVKPLNCSHEHLVCGANGGRKYEYVNELRCLIDEQDFRIDIHEFTRGATNDSHRKTDTVTLQKFLRDGLSACLGHSGQTSRDPQALPDNTLRWVHVPANNMAWIPEVLHAAADEIGPCSPDSLEVLLDDYFWKGAQNIPQHGSPHARYMNPMCIVFPPSELNVESYPFVSGTTSPSGETQALLYMPYLHWDSADALEDRDKIIQKRIECDDKQQKGFPQNNCPSKSELDAQFAAQIKLEDEIEKYLQNLEGRRRLLFDFIVGPDHNATPLHPRRCIDQYGHPFLEHISFKPDDVRTHQVLYKHTVEKNGKKNAKGNAKGNVLMVDQLWCWMINSRTVVSFFSGCNAALDLMKELKLDPESPRRPADLRTWLFDRLAGDHSQTRYPGKIHDAFDLFFFIVLQSLLVMFEYRSSDNGEPTSHLGVFGVFEKHITDQRRLSEDFQKFAKSYQSQLLQKKAQDQLVQGYLALIDVKDELKILAQLLHQQKGVVQVLEGAFSDIAKHERRRSTKHPFIESGLRRLGKYDAEVIRLAKDCRSSHEVYKDLYEMSRTQALVDEAIHGHVISSALLIFTFVTVVFSPLIFMASFFGVAAKEWDVEERNLRLKTISKYVFITSLLIIVVIVVFAVLFIWYPRESEDVAEKSATMLKNFSGITDCRQPGDGPANEHQKPKVQETGGGARARMDWGELRKRFGKRKQRDVEKDNP